jgi:hypothetical protein
LAPALQSSLRVDEARHGFQTLCHYQGNSD